MSKHRHPDTPGYHPTVTLTFPGMDNVSDPSVAKDAVLMVNVDPGDVLTLRPGMSTVLPGSFHSGWSNPDDPKEAYFVNGTLLNRLSLDGTVTAVRFDMTPGLPVTFCQVNDAVTYSDGLQMGVIENGVDTDPFTPADPYKERMVAGKYMEWYNGRLYVMVDNFGGVKGCALICSDALDVPGGIESMDTRQNVVDVFDGEATMLQRVDTGLFVGTTIETFYVGLDDAVLQGGLQAQKSVAPYGVVPGTACPVKGELIGKAGNCCLWYSARGVCLGGPGGSFDNLTQEKVSIPIGQKGTAVLWEGKGRVFYKVAMEGAGEAYNPFGSDNMNSDVDGDFI